MSDTLNVLFLGDSGQGKSTLISTIINALQYRSLDELLESGNMHCLFKCEFVEYNDHTSLSVSREPTVPITESEDKPISHTVSLGEKELVLIDTPGLNKGLEEDEANFKVISDYVDNLKHLTAVCIVMRPEDSDRNTFSFESSIRNIKRHLPDNCYSNLFFCFVNTLAQNYKPGSGISLFRHFFPSTVFEKSTVYCFENDFFKFVCAAADGKESLFEHNRNQYVSNWKQSSSEAIRLISRITNMEAFSTENRQKSSSNLAMGLMKDILIRYIEISVEEKNCNTAVEFINQKFDIKDQ